MPVLCTASMAEATCKITGSACSTDILPWVSRYSFKDMPSKYSMTI